MGGKLPCNIPPGTSPYETSGDSLSIAGVGLDFGRISSPENPIYFGGTRRENREGVRNPSGIPRQIPYASYYDNP